MKQITKSLYLDQIIDKVAVFETPVKGYNGDVNAVFIIMGEYIEEVTEGFYYTVSFKEEEMPCIPYLSYYGNDWFYRILEIPANMFLNAEVEVDLDKTRTTADEVKRLAKIIRLKSDFFDTMYSYAVDNKYDEVYYWKASGEIKKQKILKRIQKEVNNGHLLKRDRLIVVWPELYEHLQTALDREIDNRDSLVSFLPFVQIEDLALFLSLVEPYTFLPYTKNVAVLLKNLNMITADYKNGSYEKNLKAYRDYNQLLLSIARKMYDGSPNDENMYYLKVSKYINDFVLQDFLWEHYSVET